MKYKIVGITDLNGFSKTDAYSIGRIGRVGRIETIDCLNHSLVFFYDNGKNEAMVTTRVKSFSTYKSENIDMLEIRTENSIYYFKKVVDK